MAVCLDTMFAERDSEYFDLFYFWEKSIPVSSWWRHWACVGFHLFSRTITTLTTGLISNYLFSDTTISVFILAESGTAYFSDGTSHSWDQGRGTGTRGVWVTLDAVYKKKGKGKSMRGRRGGTISSV